MRTTLETVSCGELSAVYRKDDETGAVELVLVPTARIDDVVRDDCAAEPLVQSKIVGDDYPFGFSQGRTMRNAHSPWSPASTTRAAGITSTRSP